MAPIHLIIIGAGLAGLSSAISAKLANPKIKVTILETVKELAEVGAGFQLTPNSTRLFKKWGIFPLLEPHATHPVSLTVRRYDGTKVLSQTPNFQEIVQDRYRNPYWGLHRVDLQRTMVDRAKELGVEIRLDSCVVDLTLTTASPSVTLKNGETIEGDLILCADGLWSPTRSKYLGRPSPAIETGDLAYRMLFHTSDLTDPELKAFVEARGIDFWVGPNAHTVGYSLRDGELYNLVLLNPDDLPEDVSKQAGDTNELKKILSTWDPILGRFLEHVKDPTILKWKLNWLESLDEWTDGEGKFVMAGDACHPMLPYLAQGANSSLEDGAVLGWLLGRCDASDEDGTATKAPAEVNGQAGGKEKSPSESERKRQQLQAACAMYQDLRKERGEGIAKETFGQRDAWHMVDGERQIERDRALKDWDEGKGTGLNPSRW
ncbi:hypothetical protein MMC25_004210 [Agyrium rufum]|nr:hypothetical protein [Agyrium rufum]